DTAGLPPEVEVVRGDLTVPETLDRCLHDTLVNAALTKPVIYWTPIIAPGNLMFYNGAMFPQWRGSALMSGIATQSLNRMTFDGKGGATPAERWSVGHRIRDVEVGPDGALWMLEDANPGGLFRVTPK